ncbi:MAG: type II toxin-antitoxin system VapC family toxin [Limnospira sp. PMC 1291.21]|uniref:PIN superfamily protein (PilT-like) n=4 Tax=Limnospira TaxID=2596745 RepID=A0A9P1KI30_9CYAN|nr:MULTISPECIES: type II toxin-antitoxin system VapC family toxin [Limnospira]EKD07564.1 PilT protein domain protein [Arthrospira platensis C1]MDT9208858.1 type II toxin-antitoxin system VapC family toxin [Limnospira sp. PMC 1252.20]MDY7051118.1 type II toxin-antitoxin system VapC family toxin [Limnospira fusiformis LS22]QJB25862.1 type II toxin-antitoxin system VapC family toxin [Limnospira fusiformis SAG 85.79]EDZ93352.1 PilT protein domain protein [Limnospira maxima CS-328]
MSNVIMDASAILAFLNQESGSEQITDLIENATISTINLSEVIAKLAEIGISETEILQILSDLNLKIVPFDEPQAQIAGMLRPMTKPLGLSLGDRACLALGLVLNQPVITADRQWSQLNLNLEIRVIR